MSSANLVVVWSKESIFSVLHFSNVSKLDHKKNLPKDFWDSNSFKVMKKENSLCVS